MRRFISGCAAVALSLGILRGAWAVVGVTAGNFDSYCEDSGVACAPGRPVVTALQAVMGLVGLGAALSIVSRLLGYAFADRRPEGLVIRALVLVASAGIWLAVVQGAGLRGLP